MRSIFVGGGFTKEQFLWVIPLIISFAKEKKIKKIIFEKEINKKILSNEVLKDLKAFAIFEIKKSFPTHILKIFVYIIFNFNLIFDVYRSLNKKNLLSKSNAWTFQQFLHGSWDLINLNRDENLKFNFFTKSKAIISGIMKLELSEKLIKSGIRYAFLDHSVYSNRWLLANLRKENIKIYNQAVTNFHLQKKYKDTSWSEIDKNILSKLKKKKSIINIYWKKRIQSKGNYSASNLSFKFFKKKKFSIPKGKYNLILLHVFKDSPFNVIDRRRIFVDYFDWIENTLKIIKYSNESWIIKTHPISKRWGEDQKKILSILINKVLTKKTKNIQIVNNVDKDQLFRYAEKIVTFSGTAAIEAIAYNKKPIVICKSNIENISKNILFRPNSISDYNRILLNKINLKVTKNQRDLAKTIIYARENVYSMKKKIGHLEVYRGDSNLIKNKSFKLVRENLLSIYKFLNDQGKKLARGQTHTTIDYEP